MNYTLLQLDRFPSWCALKFHYLIVFSYSQTDNLSVVHFSLAEKLDASFSNTMFAHLTMTSIICASLEKQFIEVVEEIAPKFEILKFCVLG